MKTSRAPRPRQPVDTSRELDTTDASLAELIAMWPRLEAAIGVDTAGPSAAPGSGGGNAGRGSPSPVHLDTQAVMALIDVGLRKLEDQVAAVTKMTTAAQRLRSVRAQIEAQRQRRAVAKASALRIARIQDDRALTVDEHVTGIEAAYVYSRTAVAIAELHEQAAAIEARHAALGLLGALRVWYPPLVDRGHPLAGEIRKQVDRWRTDARLALGLTEPARKVGWSCPYHPDRPAELVREPHEAILAKAVIAGSRPRSGGPLSWHRSETVSCPRCKRKWVGLVQLRTLMKVIDRTTLEVFVTEQVNVAKTINDPHLHTPLYRCPKCEGISSDAAWSKVWYDRQQELVENDAAQAVLDELAAHWLCPRCRGLVGIDQAEQLDGIAVVLP